MRAFKKFGIWIVVALVCAGAVSVLLVTQLENANAVAPPSSQAASSAPAAAQPAPEPEPEPEPERIRYIETGGLELPVEGATGYTIIDTPLRAAPTEEGEPAATLPPGTCFAVLEENGDWWSISGEGFEGWVLSAKCMVNLPDVIPSIVYDDHNAYSSVFLTLGKSIPGITGEQLYNASAYNERLGREEYIMPVLYPMAKKICAAQQAALAEGNTLLIIEAFRPWSAQQAVVQAITALAEEDEAVKTAISSPPWGTDWFIATGISNHQQGYAMDLTLAKVNASEDAGCGLYDYTTVTSYARLDMQTPIHELSPASASMAGPIDPRSAEWRNMPVAEGMNDNAKLLQRYCTDAGMTPLASEWWHFNDYSALDAEIQAKANGGFTTETCRSFIPGEEEAA